ncbi:trichohyalin-like [Gouania willdenowi]|uniref:trichohyalin-like n=1 Tax=Gouania willdenowi TaxID=441366 RepID=UPI0010560033|nr:trichohyalin-like [Gouania willdenowi]
MAEDNEKSSYLEKIGFLEEEVSRCQLECSKLDEEKNELLSQYNTSEERIKELLEKQICSIANKQAKELLDELDKPAEVNKNNVRLGQTEHKLECEQSQLQRQQERQKATRNIQNQQLQQLQDELSFKQTLKKHLAREKLDHEHIVHTMKTEAEQQKERKLREDQISEDTGITRTSSNILMKEKALCTELHEVLLELDEMALSIENFLNSIPKVKKDNRLKLLEKNVMRPLIKKSQQMSMTFKQLLSDTNECIERKRCQAVGIAALSHKQAVISRMIDKKAAELNQLQSDHDRVQERDRQTKSTTELIKCTLESKYSKTHIIEMLHNIFTLPYPMGALLRPVLVKHAELFKQIRTEVEGSPSLG